MRIAPRFNAGNVVAEQFSPEGTAESDPDDHFSALPSGLVRGPPAARVSTRAYFRVSLRDQDFLNFRKAFPLTRMFRSAAKPQPKERGVYAASPFLELARPIVREPSHFAR